MKKSNRPPENAYYLVGRLEGDVLQEAEELQRRIAGLYRVYREPYPPVHLTVGVVYPQGQEELEEIVKICGEITSQSSPFLVHVRESSCFAPPYKSLNLAVNSSENLVELSRLFYKKITEAGLKAQDMKEWDFHISLVNTAYASREWTLEEFHEACYLLEKENFHLSCLMNKIELWSPRFPPLRVIASFKLGISERKYDFR